MPELDPLSQLIGAQTAQLSEFGKQLADIRTEIVTNRNNHLTFQQTLSRQFDQLEAELRNVKHDSRGAEQAHQILKAAIDKVANRVEELERLAIAWRARLMIIAAIVTATASVIGLFVPPLIEHAINLIFHTSS